jgi:co-chaperonin GroES (HSP10)
MLKPYRDRVLVRFDPPVEKKSAGGVVLTTQVAGREKVRTGMAEAIGSEVREVAAGQRVIVSGYAGSTVLKDDADLRLVNESDILAVLS